MSDSSIKDILIELGYPVEDFGNYIRTKALWRGGDDIRSVTIYPQNDKFIDHVANEKFNLRGFIQRHYSLKDIKSVDKILKEKKFDKIISGARSIKQEVDLSLTFPSSFSFDLLKKLKPMHKYWIDRGISAETIRLFKGGLVTEKENKFTNRYTFPIFSRDGEVINGFSGRAMWEPKGKDDKKFNKYKIIGQKGFFLYPLFITEPYIISEEEIILVEGVGCCLSLEDAGIHTYFNLFGVELSQLALCTIIELNPKRIIIATNNEPDNNNIGMKAAIKIQNQLLNFFDENKIQIKLPPKKDFNLCSKKEIENWYAGTK